MIFRFESGEGRHFNGGVNYMISVDGSVYAECMVPADASEDYGYLTLKNAIMSKGVKADFLYDGQEEFLEPDADAECEVYVEMDPVEEPNHMARISIDNGAHFVSVEEAVACTPWPVIVNSMDDDTREAINNKFAPCTKEEFLRRYLESADEDLIIG